MKTLNAVNHVTFAIPSRQFVINSSVTVNESLPKVTEFVLRLIRLCEGVRSEEIGQYFGFTDKETRLMMQSLSDQSLIRFEDEFVRLTEYAESKFYTDDELPRFSVVRPRIDQVDFDLLTFHPIDARKRVRAPSFTVPLPVDDENIGSSTRLAEQAYQRNFQRILRVKEKTNDKIDIYKISSVQSRELFDTPVDVSFFLDENAEVERKIFFAEDAPEAYRLGIEAAVSDALKRPTSMQSQWFTEFVERFDDKVLAQYISKKSFDFQRYVKDVHIQQNVKYGAETIPLLGNIYMPGNAERVLVALQACFRPQDGDEDGHFLASVAWVAPDSRFWGRSAHFDDFYFKMFDQLPQAKRPKKGFMEQIELLCPGTKATIRSLQQQYRGKRDKSVHFYSGDVMGGRVEVLLIPTRLACVLFHFAPPGNSTALVPLGLLTYNPTVLKEVQVFLRETLADGRNYAGKADFNQGSPAHTDFARSFGFLNYCGI